MTDNLPAIQNAQELAADTRAFTLYLQGLGLPTDNIIASSEERRIIATSLPAFVGSLGQEEKQDARYLSKFVAASAIGLFDASLNYVWNEVVLNLRKKAAIYGLDLFFDSAVGGAARSSYKSEDDLQGLKDTVLLATCHKLELISYVVYKKLDFIVTMRNEVAASHPNVEKIGAFELMGWLQTCVKEVLQDRMSDSAIRIKSLIDNLRASAGPLDAKHVTAFAGEVKNLSLVHANNLLISLFGIYVAEDTDPTLRSNSGSISKSVWDCADNETKRRLGLKIDGYRVNLQARKEKLAVEFLDLVDGRTFESIPSKIAQLERLSEDLNDKHDGWDNFYNEPPVMREILKFVKAENDIPNEVRSKLIRTVLRCRLGRGLSYCEGVSPSGRPLYDHFLSLLRDDGIGWAVISLFEPEVRVRIEKPICQKHLQAVLSQLVKQTPSRRLQEVLEYLLTDVSSAHKANRDKKFRELSSPFINWQ